MASSSKLAGVHYALIVCVTMCVISGLGWLNARREVAARDAEVQNLKRLYREQAMKLDAGLIGRKRLEDHLSAVKLDLATAELKNRELLSTISIYQQALEAAGLAANTTAPTDRGGLAPPVEGVIEEIKPAKNDRASELVQITVGSDQGMKKGDEMTVYRAGPNDGGRAKFLARIVIVDTKPGKAIGQVVERTRNGVIYKGDNVTTKL